jgi:RING finger family protein
MTQSPPIEELRWIAETLSGVKGKIRRGAPAGVEAERLRVGSGVGECQVCGDRMTSRVVYCARCRTPHHRECREYAGVCSTFACREIRFTGE